MAFTWGSKLDSAIDITSPQVGSAGAVVGSPTYAPGKFSNGIYINVFSEGFYVPSGVFGTAKGAIEFWFKPDFSLTAGTVSDDPEGHIFFDCYDTVSGHRIFARVRNLDNGIYLYYYNGVTPVTINDAVSNWTAGDLVHIAFVWDKDAGFDGSKTLAIYVNNVQKVSSVSALDPLTLNEVTHFGHRYDAGAFPVCGVIDNVKIHSNPKSDYSDKEIEGYNSGEMLMFF